MSGAIAFITGCGRSGTTILGSILARHPDVAYLNDRFDLWIRPFALTDIWGRRHQSARAHPRIELTAADAAALSPSDKARFFELLKHERADRKVLIEKLAINNFRMGFLLGLCPDAAVINIVRHGVEVARSIEQRAKVGRWYGNDDRKWMLLLRHAQQRGLGHLATGCRTPLERGLLEWRLSVDAADGFVATHKPKRFLQILYEDLIADPADVCARIETLLGLRSHEPMRAFARAEVRRRSPAATAKPLPHSAEVLAGVALRRLGYAAPAPLEVAGL